MIGKLTGVLESGGEDWALVDVRGVGYLVFCSARTLERLSVAAEPAPPHRAVRGPVLVLAVAILMTAIAALWTAAGRLTQPAPVEVAGGPAAPVEAPMAAPTKTRRTSRATTKNLNTMLFHASVKRCARQSEFRRGT